MTKQWDKYREIIIAEYKDQNKPLHEVQRSMVQKYGFRASTRAYRSRFDRWGVHKYSRRRRCLSLGRGEATSDSDGRASPRRSSDVEESSSQAATPVAETPNESLAPELSLAAPRGGFQGSVCLVETDFPYTPVTPSPSPAVGRSPAFLLNQFDSGFTPFGSQNVGSYSSMSMPMYRQKPRGVIIVAHDAPGASHGDVSIAGIQTGYGYTLGVLTGQE